MLAVDTKEHRFLRDRDLKDEPGVQSTVRRLGQFHHQPWKRRSEPSGNRHCALYTGEEPITFHRDETGSPLAADILRQRDRRLAEFVQVCPKEPVGRLEHPLVPYARLRMA